MKRRFAALLALVPLLLLQTGCWDMKTIQDMNYFTALGFDYKDGHYVAYAQMVDFSNVAKQESGKPNHKAAVWVGKQEGDSIGEAFDHLYRTSQQQVFWGHVTSIVFTENALRQGVNLFLDDLLRYGETRYTQFVYGTREPIDRLFAVTPFFSLSPLASLLAQPTENYEQRSSIRPIRLYKAIAEMREPGLTLMLPSLHIAEDVWEENQKPDPKLEIDGIFALYGGALRGWLPENRVTGRRWLEDGTVRSTLLLFHDHRVAVRATIEKPKASITPRIRNSKAEFAVSLKCKAVIAEVLQPMDMDAIKKGIVKELQEDIKRTFAYGKEHSIDLYQLEHALYHDAFPTWNRLSRTSSDPLSDYSLDEIRVDVHIIHTGMFKLKGVKQTY